MSPTYRLVGKLDAGALADLYEAERAGAGAALVMKVFHRETSDGAYALGLAETLNQMRGLRHPGLIPWTELGFVDGRLVVVRPAVDGAHLGLALKQLQSRALLLSSRSSLLLGLQLLDALGRMHAAGIVHGAITPGNVLCLATGALALTEFGALRALVAAPALRRAFATRGRSVYRAPEVSQGDAPTERSDLYSVGAIVYELLTLRQAVAAGGGMSTRREGLVLPSRIDRRINSRLDAVILRALEPSPHRRFGSCREFADALDDYLALEASGDEADELARFFAGAASDMRAPQRDAALPFPGDFELQPLGGASPGRDESPTLPLPARASSVLSPSRPARLQLAPVSEEETSALSFEDTTAPGYAGPLEQGWDAPPGAIATPVSRASLPARHGLHQGAQSPASPLVPWSLEEELPVSFRRPSPPSLEPTNPGEVPPAEEAAPEQGEPNDTEVNVFMALPRGPDSRPWPLLRASARASLLAVTCAGLAGLVVWRLTPEEALPVPERPSVQSPQVEGAQELEAPVRDIGFLSLSTDVPAAVFIDGVRVTHPTPLVRFPVRAGVRRVELRALRARSRKTLSLSFREGQHRTVRGVLRKAPRR